MVLYLFVSKKNCRLFWRGVSDYFALIALFNTILTFLRPEGLLTASASGSGERAYYLLGNTNQIIPFYVIAVAVAIVWSQTSGKNRWRALFLFVQAVLSNLVYMAATAWVMLFAFGVLWLLFGNERLKRSKRRKGLAVLGVAGVFAWYYAIIVLEVQQLFRGVIEGVLHKDITLSTRVEIWEDAVAMIKKSPLLGYGGIEGRYLVYATRSYDAHNLVLQVLLMGGAVLLCALIVLILMSFRNWTASPVKERNALLVLFITFAIGSSVEVFVFTYPFLILLMLYLLGIRAKEAARNAIGGEPV